MAQLGDSGITLITDRTSADVSRWKQLNNKGWAQMSEVERSEWLTSQKGSYNYTDLNRVEGAVAYVAERLTNEGYTFVPTVKTTWTVGDIPTKADMERYLGNIRTLRSVFTVYKTTPSAPPKGCKLDYQTANALERILLDVDDILTKLIASWFYSGDVYSGEV